MRKNTIVLLGILLIAAFLRFLWLDKIPHSINGDELHYLLSAKSFFLTGKDVTQTTSLFSPFLFKYPPGEVQAELPYFVEMLFLGPFAFSLFGTFLPNALMGIGVVWLLFLITKKLITEEAALFASTIAAVNPWFIFIGRSAYEMIPATFFYLCSLYVLLITKGWRILFALPLFMLAFYSYIGTKLILLPVALVFVLYAYFFVHKKRFAKQYIILLAALILFVGFFGFQLKQAPGTSRLSEIATPSSYDTAASVDQMRKVSIHSPFLSLFENKFTAYIGILLTNLFDILSPDYLFLHGDFFASFGKYGLFYPIDFVLILFGIGALYARKKNALALLTMLILIAMIPQIFYHAKERHNFTPHITLLIPFVIILIGAGAHELVTSLKKIKLHIITATFVLLYVFSVGSFLNIYFFQLPLQPNFFNVYDRLLDHYISLSQNSHRKIIVYSSIPQENFKEYIFYNDLYNANTAMDIAQELQKSHQTIDYVTFSSCNKDITKANPNTISIVDTKCGMEINSPHVTIPQLSDSGAVYQIYNDPLCNQYPLNHFISNVKIDDFNVESLNGQRFCQTFINSL